MTGSRMPTSTAIIPMTTRSSTRVNALSDVEGRWAEDGHSTRVKPPRGGLDGLPTMCSLETIQLVARPILRPEAVGRTRVNGPYLIPNCYHRKTFMRRLQVCRRGR